jgi:hypothetical protein
MSNAVRRLSIVILLSLAPLLALAQQRPPDDQRPPERPPQTKYEVIVPGMVANSPFDLQFRSADLRLQVRDLIMGRGEARDVPVPARILMELRGGGVSTTINGAKSERTQGDLWIVEKGDRLTVQNDLDVAVIRAVYIFERER